jgi:hypothetical protein
VGKIVVLLLLFSLSVSARQEKPYEYENLMKQFIHRLDMPGPERCSPRNFTNLLMISHEIYVWGRFYDSVDELDIYNGLYKIVTTEARAQLDEDEAITYPDVVNALKVWYRRNCVKRSQTVARGLASKGDQNDKTNKH